MTHDTCMKKTLCKGWIAAGQGWMQGGQLEVTGVLQGKDDDDLEGAGLLTDFGSGPADRCW